VVQPRLRGPSGFLAMGNVLDRPGAAIHVEFARQEDARTAERTKFRGKDGDVTALVLGKVRG
jgi:hypothetical protein